MSMAVLSMDWASRTCSAPSFLTVPLIRGTYNVHSKVDWRRTYNKSAEQSISQPTRRSRIVNTISTLLFSIFQFIFLLKILITIITYVRIALWISLVCISIFYFVKTYCYWSIANRNCELCNYKYPIEIMWYNQLSLAPEIHDLLLLQKSHKEMLYTA
jgi:hypothetical protein